MTTTTAEPILPSLEEAALLAPPRDGAAWRASSDVRVMSAAGYALLLQVAHPTVGAGVAEHSNFKAEPWGRLLRTLDFTTSMVYGGPQLAHDTGRRVREMHKTIKGVKPDGENYHALEPEAYTWVHATLAAAVVEGNRLFARPMSREEKEAFWAEWRRMGRLLGVRERDLPETWVEFGDYFDTMVADVLTDTESARDVLTFTNTAPPPLPWLRPGPWKVARLPLARIFQLATVGMMPPLLRAKLGHEWSRARDIELRTLARLSRAATPLLPRAAREFGPSYLRWRAEQIAGGSVASPERFPAPRAA